MEGGEFGDSKHINGLYINKSITGGIFVKRVIVFVLTLVLILSLTACGSSTQPEGGNESDAGKTETYNYTWSACNSTSG